MGKILKSKTFIVTIIILIIAISIVLGFLYFKEYISGNITAKKNIEEIKELDKELSTETSTELKENTYYSLENVYDIMHRMSNSKIIAEDNEIWGTLPMDMEDIKSLKNVVSKINYHNRDYLLEVLTRWEKNDFSKVVEEHNFLWNKLGGNVGKAIGIKE